MAEMDAALKGLNLTVAWGMTCVRLMTDSVIVHRWISDILTGKACLRTIAAGGNAHSQVLEDLENDLL